MIQLLDCTLRDGAYINNSEFGIPALKGIIKHLQDSDVEIIECGWLKDTAHKEESSYFHLPKDAEFYILEKKNSSTYVAMIDYNRYDDSVLPECDGKSLDAIRVVFPHGKHAEGIAIGNRIAKKGYKIFYQAANTLAYSDEDLVVLANEMNKARPIAVSIVDTFGAMYEDDLIRIFTILNKHLDNSIKIGFHAHNNQQLAFALSSTFIELAEKSGRDSIADSSLCGMGRGAGNTTTELMASYLNRKHHKNYDMNEILDAIDMYMTGFAEKYTWGYSTPYFIAGLYQCHVNNIAYLQKNHRTNARDMSNIIASLSQTERRAYDYDLLEKKYMENQNRIIDDSSALKTLRESFAERRILLLAPGKTIITEKEKIKAFIKKENPVVIAVNAIHKDYDCDYITFINSVRYQYAKESYGKEFSENKKILLSSIKTSAAEDEFIVNFDSVIKRGWEHFDNAVICCLRLMNKLDVQNVVLAGFDGFKTAYNESYADSSLPTLNPNEKWSELNEEIKDMFKDFVMSSKDKMTIEFITESIFEECLEK
ncbi:MAG: hypothetical protein J6N81_04000 [Treponema sp.]|nr:hypothetical protein [Treponema sp.]